MDTVVARNAVDVGQAIAAGEGPRLPALAQEAIEDFLPGDKVRLGGVGRNAVPPGGIACRGCTGATDTRGGGTAAVS